MKGRLVRTRRNRRTQPDARHGRQDALVPGAHDAEPWAICAEVLAGAVEDVEAAWRDHALPVEGQGRGEVCAIGGDGGVVEDGPCVYLVRNEVQAFCGAGFGIGFGRLDLWVSWCSTRILRGLHMARESIRSIFRGGCVDYLASLRASTWVTRRSLGKVYGGNMCLT